MEALPQFILSLVVGTLGWIGYTFVRGFLKGFLANTKQGTKRHT